ncbi:hypothetical protein [Spirosoma areae]
MEDYEQKTGWLTWLLGGLSLVLLAGGIYFWNGNKTLTRQNDRAERRADSLLSVRLQLETDLSKLNDQLATTKVDNTDLNKRIEAAYQRLAQNDARLGELRRSTAGRVLTIRELNQNVATLTTQRDSLGNQMNAMNAKIGWLTDSSTVYQSRNEQLGQEITQLNSTLLTMVPRTSLTGDGFRVEAVKSNDKATAKAKKVETLTISLNVPAELGLTGQQDVYLSLTNEASKAMMPPLRSETVTLPTLNETIPVHAVQSITFGSAKQRITFRLDPGANLKPGFYRAAVYTKNAYLGSVEFRFRDSFWFF